VNAHLALAAAQDAADRQYEDNWRSFEHPSHNTISQRSVSQTAQFTRLYWPLQGERIKRKL